MTELSKQPYETELEHHKRLIYGRRRIGPKPRMDGLVNWRRRRSPCRRSGRS